MEKLKDDGSRALAIAANTQDAYSMKRWGSVAWVQATQMLCDMGLTDDEVEGVLRSKLTRWAADAYDEPTTYLGQLAAEVRDHLKREGNFESLVG